MNEYTEEILEALEDGAACSFCGCVFQDAAGSASACRPCFDGLSYKDRKHYRRAV